MFMLEESIFDEKDTSSLPISSISLAVCLSWLRVWPSSMGVSPGSKMAILAWMAGLGLARAGLVVVASLVSIKDRPARRLGLRKAISRYLGTQ